ncbi:glycosyl hydrolase 115 family protein [Sphingomonas mollis]|uniref:Glycosyl hydrolase 115 family protein n=1 Tax=Sphingomonas mollis TaxID=2795726 RepID=A0ABS0XQZ0_9SPHN|nr:glycosyl hydrolase 115 family protein [Sphingomonas sp. BT553]MBJ6122449.1 glycosyl hydrolase 115 family protein [Sphingomonas sp. BT553]
MRITPLLLILTLLTTPAAAQLATGHPTKNSFPLAAGNTAAPILHDPADHPVVARAAADLASDIRAVTGITTTATTTAPIPGTRPVIIGTLGRNRTIDALVRAGKLDVHRLRGAWESFLITVVRRPAPGLPAALVIVGSDRRGTAFGVYELSQSIGVSPWHWWADVPAKHHAALHIAAGTHRFGPPSVKYRGVFLNDEDWGLHPWAARTFEPENGGIGPKTYERLFDLMLRLKANTVWPAMHHVSAPFNRNPANAKLADDYAIVMGSSHAEPMLRDNVGEWTDAPDRFNYATNRDGVRAYWDERVRTNARYESLWTLGMRGIHDSGIVGADTPAGKIDLLDRVFADQRAMLAANIDPQVDRIPQMFVPYKEVLDLYRAGLKVPDDVTLVWPDDNFGYIRQFPNAAERRRSGGSGIYYHLSYLGAPLSYLWLGTTPPALIRTEMTRAFDQGARSVWIANVGDLKPAEIGVTAFLDLAWNVEASRTQTQATFLADWTARTFGGKTSQQIADVLNRWYTLNLERRPEHLQWWLPGQRARRSPLTPTQIDTRLAAFDALVADLDRIEPAIPPAQADAFFELVAYPVRAAALANRRYFAAERYATTIDAQPAIARRWGADANRSDTAIKALTRRFDTIAGGKWRGFMAEEPADNQWTSYRTVPLALPAAGLVDDSPPPTLSPASDPAIIEAESVEPPQGWRFVAGLGRGTGAMIAAGGTASLSYDLTLTTPQSLAIDILPTFPGGGGDSAFHLTVTIDGHPHAIVIPRTTGDPAWSAGVLDNLLSVPIPGTLPPGRHRVTIASADEGLALDRLRLAAPQ